MQVISDTVDVLWFLVSIDRGPLLYLELTGRAFLLMDPQVCKALITISTFEMIIVVVVLQRFQIFGYVATSVAIRVSMPSLPCGIASEVALQDTKKSNQIKSNH